MTRCYLAMELNKQGAFQEYCKLANWQTHCKNNKRQNTYT